MVSIACLYTEIVYHAEISAWGLPVKKSLSYLIKQVRIVDFKCGAVILSRM
jgi:hypothetical protein